VVSEPKCFVRPDHPVRSIKGGFAASFLMSRPPLLCQEGSSATRPFKEGWLRLNKKIPFVSGADGVVGNFKQSCDQA
jgi:hypothetical protein